jgi:hypothetical protein
MRGRKTGLAMLRQGFSDAFIVLHCIHRRDVQLNAPTMKTVIFNAQHRKATRNHILRPYAELKDRRLAICLARVQHG